MPASSQTQPDAAVEDLFSGLPDTLPFGTSNPQPARPRRRGAGDSGMAESAGVAANTWRWVNGHRWLVAVLMLNVVCLVASVRHGIQFTALAGVEAFFGLIVIGLLFVPRFHLVRRIVSAVGTAGASMGAGGFVILLLVAGGKLLRASDKVAGMGLDTSQLLHALVAVAASVAGFAIALGLWHLLGFARVLSSVYIAQLAMLSMLFVTHEPEGDQLISPRPSATMAAREGFQGSPIRPGLNRRHPSARRELAGGVLLGSDATTPNPRTGTRSQRMELSTAAPTGPHSATARPLKVIVHHQSQENVIAIRSAVVMASRNSPWRVQREPGQATIVLQYAGSVDELASRIRFGRITSIDRATREITIKTKAAS